MYIAMNRFRIALGREADFENLWRSRESHLDGTPGFRTFHLLRGATTEECTLFASHTTWETKAAFEAWTRDIHLWWPPGHTRHGGRVVLQPERFVEFEVLI